MSNPTSSRLRAIALYKQLHRIGRDYPDPNYNFHAKLRSMYEKNRTLTDEKEIEKALQLAEFIRNETLALISLSKYRHLKRVYYPNAPTQTPTSQDGKPT